MSKRERLARLISDFCKGVLDNDGGADHFGGGEYKMNNEEYYERNRNHWLSVADDWLEQIEEPK